LLPAALLLLPIASAVTAFSVFTCQRITAIFAVAGFGVSLFADQSVFATTGHSSSATSPLKVVLKLIENAVTYLYNIVISIVTRNS
jgi:hypothetical protein